MSSKPIVSLVLVAASAIFSVAGCSSPPEGETTGVSAERLSAVSFGTWTADRVSPTWTAPTTVNVRGRSETMLATIGTTAEGAAFSVVNRGRSITATVDPNDQTRLTVALSSAATEASPRARIQLDLESEEWRTQFGAWLKENNELLPPGEFAAILAHAPDGVRALQAQTQTGGVAPKSLFGILGGIAVAAGVLVAIVEVYSIICERTTQLQCQTSPYGGEWCKEESFRSCVGVSPQEDRCVGGGPGTQCRTPPPPAPPSDDLAESP